MVVIFNLLYSLLDLSCGECDGISLYFMCCSVNGSIVVLCGAYLTVFVNCLVKQFALCLGVVSILLLNVMEAFSVGVGALLHRPCMVFQIMCELCSDPSGHLSVPSIGFVYVFVCGKLSLQISLRAGSQVFMLFLCEILYTMWSGKSMKLLCILPFGML